MSYTSMKVVSETLTELLTDEITSLKQIRIASITNYEFALKSVNDISNTPALIISMGPQTFEERRIFKLVAIKLLLIMPYENVSGKNTVSAWEIADQIESLFAPINFPEEQVTYNGILFIPEGVQPVELDKCSRSVYLIELTAKLPITITKE